jgi:FtsP/CotA-like multicopper oxidase with cupredoxin domain
MRFYSILTLLLSLFTLNSFSQGSYNQKFVSPLDIPPVLFGPEINLVVDEGSHEFFNGFMTHTYGVNGAYGGPVIFLNKGDSVVLNVTNQLEGMTTMHWHGLHVAAKDDGGVRTPIEPNETWSPRIKVLDEAATYWYHPHPHGLTTQQTTLGITGLIIVRDENEQNLDLPRNYGVDDFPLVIQSKAFGLIDKQINPLASETHFVVNSTVYPYHEVPQQLVRLRILNGSNLRVINIGFSDDRTFYQIASDGGLLHQPVALNRLKLSSGERAEILVDFSDLTILGEGSEEKLFLVNYARELPAGTPGTLFTAAPSPLDVKNTRIMEYRAISATPSPVSEIPETLIEPWDVWDESEVDVTRRINFEVDLIELISSGFISGFSFDNHLFHHHHIDHETRLGDIEIWELYNNTPFSHPFHIHDVQFYILDRNGIPPPMNELGRKDVVLVNPFETVRFITRFEDFADDYYTYMYHCHILSHEDEGMMGQFLVLDTTVTSINNFSNGIDFKIYPNPAVEKIVIELPNENIDLNSLSFEMSNNLGQIIDQDKLSNRNTTIDLENIAKGIYYLKILDNKNQLFGIQPFVKK